MIATLLLLSLPAVQEPAAPPMGWRFAEVQIVRFELDDAGEDPIGFGARAAYEIESGLFFHGRFALARDDGDLRRVELGIGHHVPVDAGLDLFGILSYVDVELDDAGGADFDEDGFRVEGGPRFRPTDALQLEGLIGWEDVGDGELLWGAGARYWVQPNVGLALEYERVDDDARWTLGLRYAF